MWAYGGETANPSALGLLRKYDAMACQGSISKWALLSAVLLSRASGQLSGFVWDFSYLGGGGGAGDFSADLRWRGKEGASVCYEPGDSGDKREATVEGKCQVLEWVGAQKSRMEKSFGPSKVHCNLRPKVLEGLGCSRRRRGPRKGVLLGIPGGTQRCAVQCGSVGGAKARSLR